MIDINKHGAGDRGPAGSTDSPSHELARLATLHQQGLLTDVEFAAAKARVLGLAPNRPPAGAPLPAATPRTPPPPPRTTLGDLGKALLWLLAAMIMLTAGWVIYNLGQGGRTPGAAPAALATGAGDASAAGAAPACDDPRAIETLQHILRRQARHGTADDRRVFRAIVGIPADEPEGVTNPVQVYARPDQGLRVCVADVSLPREIVAVGYGIVHDDTGPSSNPFRLQLMSATEARSRFAGPNPVADLPPSRGPTTDYLLDTASAPTPTEATEISVPGTVATALSPPVLPTAPDTGSLPPAPTTTAPATTMPVPATGDADIPPPTTVTPVAVTPVAVAPPVPKPPREMSGGGVPIASRYEPTDFVACQGRAGLSETDLDACYGHEIGRVNAVLVRAYNAALAKAQAVDGASKGPRTTALRQAENAWWRARDRQCEGAEAEATLNQAPAPARAAMACRAQADYQRAVELWRFDGSD